MNMNIFVRLVGFHQLMNFLGSIDPLMEGSGLRTALETVYAPVTVGHMFTGKAYSRAIRGHLLSEFAVLSLMPQKFWNSLTPDECKLMKEIYHSEAPSNHENDEISTKLLSWFNTRRQELSEDSSTSVLWLNYVHYVLIVLEFIRAERTNNWSLHILATKSMLKQFAATGHNNYARTCRLYLQSMLNLEKDHPDVHQQFILGNHTVRHTSSSWSGLWTDLSIEKILMKLLKGRSGVT